MLAVDLKVPIALNSCSGNVPHSLRLIRSDLGVVTVIDWPLVGMLCSICSYVCIVQYIKCNRQAGNARNALRVFSKSQDDSRVCAGGKVQDV